MDHAGAEVPALAVEPQAANADTTGSHAAAVAAATEAEALGRFSSPPLTQLLKDLGVKNSGQSAVVYRVVLTGGPCGGKTTAMSTLTERFQALGWRVFRVPEAATMLLSGGHSFANLNKLQQYQFQAALLKLMLSLEEAFLALARSTHEKCILLCDRGTMDCRSYMPEDEWEQLALEVGSSTLALRDERYDCVVHMVTAANGAAAFYTTEGHAARSEPAAYAMELDTKIKNNWVGHPYFHIIDNSTDFNGKIRRVMSTICQFVGLQGDVGLSKRKFLVSPNSVEKVAKGVGFDADRIAFPDEIRYSKFEVDHDYITRPDQDVSHQLRLRRRGLNGQFTYSYTLRYPDLHGQRVELKRLVNRREYFDLLLQRDPSTQTVTKKRYSFLYENQYYELDQFVSPHKGLYLLEFHAPSTSSAVLPPWFKYEGEVTSNKSYSMYQLAAKKEPTARARSASVTKTQSEITGEGSGEAAHALTQPERQSSGELAAHGIAYACASAPTSPQIKASALNSASAAAAVPERKL